MHAKSNPEPGRLYLVAGSPETTGAGPSRGGEHLDRARLVVVSPGVDALDLSDVPDATPVVCLARGDTASFELAAGLAREALVDGGVVVWLWPADAGGPSVTGQAPGPLADVRRWLAEQGIEAETLAQDTPAGKLAGSWVLLPRARSQAAETSRRLRKLGATVLSQPAIAIGPPADAAALDATLDRLGSYDWLVFSSANGVRFVLERLWDRSGDLRRLGGVKLAAIGPGTSEALAEYRLRADVVPDEYRAEALADALSAEARGKRFLLARASRGREVLAERLSAAGAEVEQVVAYESTDVCPDEARLRPVLRLLDEDRIDWLPVTSSAIARSVVRLFGRSLAKTRLASISPITSEVLRGLGHEPAVEARRYTIDGVIEAMVGS